ncbi:hypothetical protein AVEN_98297-1 [Araneus ventricosus]|nr:hypothetical protein AVEN_98297-1 [Araneus ventricosus]
MNLSWHYPFPSFRSTSRRGVWTTRHTQIHGGSSVRTWNPSAARTLPIGHRYFDILKNHHVLNFCESENSIRGIILRLFSAFLYYFLTPWIIISTKVLSLLALDLNRDGLTRTICAVAILVGVCVADYLTHKIKLQRELIDIELEMSEVMDNVDDLQNAIYELQTMPKCDWHKILKGMIRDFKITKESRKRARKA